MKYFSELGRNLRFLVFEQSNLLMLRHRPFVCSLLVNHLDNKNPFRLHHIHVMEEWCFLYHGEVLNLVLVRGVLILDVTTSRDEWTWTHLNSVVSTRKRSFTEEYTIIVLNYLHIHVIRLLRLYNYSPKLLTYTCDKVMQLQS
jgi:hypothetical protein